MLNAMKFYDKLEQAGFSKEQADIVVSVMVDLMNENLASKHDLDKQGYMLRTELREEATKLRSEMKEEFANVRSEMKEEFANVRSEMKDLRHDMLTKLGSMIVVSTTLLGVLIKIL